MKNQPIREWKKERGWELREKQGRNDLTEDDREEKNWSKYQLPQNG